MPDELVELMNSPETRRYMQTRQALQAIAETCGLFVRHCDMPSNRPGWIIDGVTSKKVGDRHLREVLEHLAQSAREQATVVFIAVESVTFRAVENDIMPTNGRSAGDQRLYDWLVNDLGWHSLGSSDRGWSELVGSGIDGAA